jgi:hypothetical protein
VLSGDDLRSLLTELGEDLAKRGLRGDLFVVGGAAMALAYDTRRATRNVDAVFEPKAAVYAAARRVAARHGLPDNWLNDAVEGFLLGDDPEATVAFTHPGVRVRVASPFSLFVLKIMAARVERDADDIAALWQLCGFTAADQALDLVQRTYPELRLQPKVQYLLEEIAAANQRRCGQIVTSTGLPCRLNSGHRGRCRSR